jgi:hypothetical protein
MKQEEPKDLRSTPDTTESLPSSSRTAGPLDPALLSQDHTAPSSSASLLEAQHGSGTHTQILLSAYKQTLEIAKDLPTVVWVRWGGKGLGRFLKVPYSRWFLEYFLTHHIHKSLNALNRELHAIAAVSSDHDVNKWDREAAKLFLQSLPPPPYRRLAFAIFFVALLMALPLRSFGDVTHVLDLVGAIMKVDIGGVGKAFTAQEFWETVRSMLVLLVSFSIVASLLTSPFMLKRMLFNLYPAAKERLGSVSAKDQSRGAEGLYKLEDRAFGEVGIRSPKEAPLDLLFRAFVLVLILLLSVFLGSLTLFAALVGAVPEHSVAEFGGTVTVSWSGVWFVAFLAIVFFIAFVVGLRRLLCAWRNRARSASS